MKQGKEYPAAELRDCYKKLLLNQFHDILPGSHINPVFCDAVRDYEDLEKRLDAIINDSDSVFFNPLNKKRREASFIPSENGAFVRRESGDTLPTLMQNPFLPYPYPHAPEKRTGLSLRPAAQA